MSNTITDVHDHEVDGPPIPSRAERHRVVRQAMFRRALATTAAIGIAATVVALTALPGSSRPKSVHLPSARAANAAFTSGLLSGLGGSTAASTAAPAAAPTGAVAVKIENYAFSPATLTVGIGTKVTWTNDDTAPHTVTVTSGPVKFNSPTLHKGDTYTFTFTTAGTYSYYCAVHPDMTAKVVVTGSTPTATPTTASATPTTPTTSSSMPMPTSSGDGTCAVTSGLQTLLTHINTAHLQESPGQQAQDILDVDQYIGSHLALVEKILDPLTSGGLTTALSGLVQTLLTHIDTAHLEESPGQQAQDILDINSYIGNHLALVQRMLGSVETLTC